MRKYPDRIDIIQSTINRKNYKTYPEIGCDKYFVFKKISINEKVGVDPISEGTIRDTSDNFFKYNKSKFDIIFIDGLHEYNQVKKDIKNSLNVLNDNGVIFLHDCVPMHLLYQAHSQSHINFNGDIWKNITEIRHEANLDTYIIFADHGIGMIFKRPNKKLLNVGKLFRKPRVILCKNPVVSLYLGGMREIIFNKYNRYLVKCYDTKDFAKGIKYCIKNIGILTIIRFS